MKNLDITQASITVINKQRLRELPFSGHIKESKHTAVQNEHLRFSRESNT